MEDILLKRSTSGSFFVIFKRITMPDNSFKPQPKDWHINLQNTDFPKWKQIYF